VLPAPAPRAGRSPEVWEPRTFDKESDRYDPDNPDKLCYDSRGKARNEEILAEIRKDTREWARHRDTCGALRTRLEERRAHLAALNARKNFIRELKSRLEDRIHRRQVHRRRGRQSGGDANGGGGGDDDSNNNNGNTEEDEKEEEEWATAKAEDIDELRSTAVVTTETDSGSGSGYYDRDGPSFDDLGVDVDDLEGCTAAELSPKLVECTRMCARALEGVKELKREVNDRRSWDVVESGLETRDVLENGVGTHKLNVVDPQLESVWRPNP
jgi:hypothetical protein